MVISPADVVVQIYKAVRSPQSRLSLSSLFPSRVLLLNTWLRAAHRLPPFWFSWKEKAPDKATL